MEYGAASILLDADSDSLTPARTQISVLGNPVRDRALFAIQSPPARAARWTVTDALGRTVLSSSIELASGSPKVGVPTNELATGVYRFTVVSGEAGTSVPFTVIR